MASNKNILRALATAKKVLNFDDHHSVYTHKSNWELLRALIVLRICGSNYLVDNSMQLFQSGQRILGNKGLEFILDSTIYKQFVAGNDGEALIDVAKKLEAVGLKLMVAPTLEEDIGECNSRQDRYDCNLKELIQLAEHTCKHGGRNSCLQTKITALLSADTLLKLSKVYSEAKSSEKTSLVEKVANALCANELLLEELSMTEILKCCFAAKIVRGAYLERERQLNENQICQSYIETGNNFDRVVDSALKNIAQSGSHKNLFLVATHNESAIHRATERMKDLGISSDSKNIYFAQIYGMAEQISIPLASAGYRVYKSVPIGPLAQVLPYLARRLAENRAVLRGARRETELLQKELLCRLTLSTTGRT